MIDVDGEEWLTVAQAAERFGIPEATIRSWVMRGKVAGHRIYGRRWVCLPDVMAAEHATRGAYVAQRVARVQH